MVALARSIQALLNSNWYEYLTRSTNFYDFGLIVPGQYKKGTNPIQS